MPGMNLPRFTVVLSGLYSSRWTFQSRTRKTSFKTYFSKPGKLCPTLTTIAVGKVPQLVEFVTANTARTYFRTFNKKSKLFCAKETDQAEQSEIEKITETEWKKFISKMAWDKVCQTLSEPVINTFELLSKGLSPQEVSDKLDIPYNTVCVYKKRVVNKISKEIADLEDEIG